MDDKLIQLLADGHFHSGEYLGSVLGVSRTAVWKHLQQLESLGLPVETVRGKGYRLPGGVELLNASHILGALDPTTAEAISQLDILSTVDSTNRYVMDRGSEGARAVCFAEHQAHGRGRRGKSWSSPFGRNIYLSIGWEFSGGAASLEGLSLAVGIALRRCFADRHELRLKWPNDLHYQSRKVAGILLEMQGDPAGVCQVVVGIGVNLGMLGEERPEIDQPWADGLELGVTSRNALAATILNQLVPVLETFPEKGFRHYLDEWNRHDACRGLQVRLHTPVMDVCGVARGVAANGAILIEVNGSISAFNGGELSLRLLQ